MKRFIFLIFLGTFMSLSTAFSTTNKNEYSIKILSGENISPLIQFLSQQRIINYKNYPYLYEGTMAEDVKHVSWLAQQPGTAVAVAYKDSKPVGFLTGTSFVNYGVPFKDAITVFKNAGLNPEEYFYLPDLIVLSPHDNLVVGDMLAQAMEKYARSLGYTKICFADETHESHPLKPTHYIDPDEALKKAGYHKSALSITASWPTLQKNNSTAPQEHILVYWLKNL